MADPSPRGQLRQKIRDALEGLLLLTPEGLDQAADRVVGLFHAVDEEVEQFDVSTLGDSHEQLLRQRTIVGRVHGSRDDQVVKGRYRGAL